MLLIIEALLLISAALGKDHRAAVKGKIFPLDMALNSVDDQYKGCRENMANLVKTEYLKKELKNSDEFNRAWKKSSEFIKPEDKLTDNHLKAIYVYSDCQVFKDFNNDARSGKLNYENKSYKWYSLHFLLTDAIQILKEQNKCIKTYRGTNVKFEENVENREVRFGSFASSSRNQKTAKSFGTESCFEIETCEGAEVTKYSKLRHESEVLIPPYEKFKVTAVKKKGQEGAWCNTVFILKSSGIKSELNCALFRKPTKSIKKY
ncbi:T-cell ecto-ADP-ribosyltransferase 1-like [Carassius auratus]|uniref:NAD(P)(+)--arginine ADP-ribosyltransferase n=1 Tax=Carassius auratus TaxID=7957 RepID=A0A6P6MH66_CARAU|nr:T-cell ecto-ADP-ribosyltransferase 1-like [Carassius auratus]XP_026096055.1 T-cell ecto-ADP-ribosyltransferase 1-like [Carassius auratus]